MLLVSGFDDIDAIVEMNTDDGSTNSITVIETYIHVDKRKKIYQDALALNKHPTHNLNCFQ